MKFLTQNINEVTTSKELDLGVRVNSPNTGCLLNIGNGPQSGPPLYSKAEGRKVAQKCVERPKSGIW